MKRILFMVATFLVVWFCPADSKGTTLSSLIENLRHRLNEVDTATSNFTDTTAIVWANDAQDKIVVLGGYLEKQIDLIYSEDSSSYALPEDFKTLKGVMVRSLDAVSGIFWYSSTLNLFFVNDGSNYMHYPAWKSPDSARLYVRSPRFIDGDTIRVHYYGSATEMTAGTDTLQVPRDREVFVVEEMMAMYWAYMRNIQVYQALVGQNRQDMGINRQVESK